jgi:hypothetical protein
MLLSSKSRMTVSSSHSDSGCLTGLCPRAKCQPPLHAVPTGVPACVEPTGRPPWFELRCRWPRVHTYMASIQHDNEQGTLDRPTTTFIDFWSGSQRLPADSGQWGL